MRRASNTFFILILTACFFTSALCIADRYSHNGSRRGFHSSKPDKETILISPTSLPQPFATPSADNGPRIIPQPADASLKLPPGFKAEVFAEGLNNPRWLTVAPNGDVFVVESGPNRVTLLRDTTGAGKRISDRFSPKISISRSVSPSGRTTSMLRTQVLSFDFPINPDR